MKNIVKGVSVLIILLALTVSPLSVKNLLINGKRLIHANEYQKIKMKVDSLAVITQHHKNTSPSTFYELYFNDSIKVIVDDHDGALLNQKKGKDRLEPHVDSTMLFHNDSVWIWYYAKSEPKYAKFEDIHMPLAEERSSLLLDGTIVTIAVCGLIILFVIIKRVRKQNNRRFNENKI